MIRDFPRKGCHISITYSIEHPEYPPGMGGCVRIHATMIGYLFEPMQNEYGTKITWIYINDLKGKLPGVLVQGLANKMQRTSLEHMSKAMHQLENGTLDLSKVTGIIYK